MRGVEAVTGENQAMAPASSNSLCCSSSWDLAAGLSALSASGQPETRTVLYLVRFVAKNKHPPGECTASEKLHPRMLKGTSSMKSNIVGSLICLLALGLSASAGTLSGSVKGAHGQSVVYLEPSQGKAPAPASTQAYKMDQKGMKFVPHVMAVPTGATVEFDNDDVVAHNVYWPSISGDKKLHHNLGTFPPGQAASFKFERPGVVPIRCSLHPDMSAYIIVSPSPYNAVTDEILGDYFIANVPDGQYKAVVWHEGKSEISQEIKVAGNTKMNFTLK